MSSTDESSETALVAYTKFAGDMARAVQETISLREIRPENRVVVDGGMYIASATNLVLEPSGFLGFLFLAFYREMPEDSEDKINVTPQCFSMLVLNKFFKRIKDKPDVVHEGKKYQRMWHLWSGDGDIGHWIILCGGVQREALGRMKVQLVKKKKLLLSNEFLSVLFTPIVESLRELYVEIGKF